MRAEVEAAWAAYQQAVTRPRHQRRRFPRAHQDTAEVLLAALRCQAELDQLARRLIGLDADHPDHLGRRRHDELGRLSMARLLQSDVVAPFVYLHRYEHDVLDWALTNQDLDMLWRCGVFEDFEVFDRVTGDELIGARTYLLSLRNEPRHWHDLARRRLHIVDFLTHEMSNSLGPIGGPEGTVTVARSLLATLALVDQAPPGVFTPRVYDQLDEYRAELCDWLHYGEAGRPGDFTAWCAARGSTHAFSRPPRFSAFVYPSKTSPSVAPTPDGT